MKKLLAVCLGLWFSFPLISMNSDYSETYEELVRIQQEQERATQGIDMRRSNDSPFLIEQQSLKHHNDCCCYCCYYACTCCSSLASVYAKISAFLDREKQD